MISESLGSYHEQTITEGNAFTFSVGLSTGVEEVLGSGRGIC